MPRVPAAALLVAITMAAAAVDDGVVMECSESTYTLLDAGREPRGGIRPLSSWAWMGDLPFNPVLVERFRQAAHLEGPAFYCAVRVPIATLRAPYDTL